LDYLDDYPVDLFYYKDENYLNNLKNNLNSKYWILANLNLNDDFIKKAILHYKYLNPFYGIIEGNHEFKLGLESSNENILFSKDRLDCLEYDKNIDVYYI